MSERALRSRGKATAAPVADPPKKRASRKKNPAYNDALATSVEGLEEQTPSINSEPESEIQASADTRSPSPSSQLQPTQTMSRRTTRSMSREPSPSLATTSAPTKVKKTRNARVASTTKARTDLNGARGTNTPGRPKKTAPKKATVTAAKKGKNKRTADDSASEQDTDTDTDNESRRKRVRRELSAASAPFSPIPEVEEEEDVEPSQQLQIPEVEEEDVQPSMEHSPEPSEQTPIPEAEDEEDVQPSMEHSPAFLERTPIPTPAPATLSQIVPQSMEDSPEANEPEEKEDAARTTSGSREQSVEILENVSHSVRHSPEAPQESMQSPPYLVFPGTSTRAELIITVPVVIDKVYQFAQEKITQLITHPRDGGQLEVGQIEPELPATPRAPEPVRGFFTSVVGRVVGLVTSPFKFMGRQDQNAAVAATNNNEADTPQFTYRQSHNLGELSELNELSETPTRAPRPQGRGSRARSQSMGPQRNPQQRQRPKLACPKPINPKSRSKSPVKSATVGRSQFRRDGPAQPSTPIPMETEQERQERLKQLRAKLDAMTPEEKARHEQKNIDLAKKMADRKKKVEANLALDELRKRASRSAFPDIDEYSASAKSKKQKMVESTPGSVRHPSPNGSSSDEEENSSPGKNVTPFSGGGSPMSLDTSVLLSCDLPAELAHPLSRAYGSLFTRQVELFQAEMNEDERKLDNQFMEEDYPNWKLSHLFYGPMKEEEDEDAWKIQAEFLRKNPFATEDSIASQKNGFIRSTKEKRELYQLQDIERRKEKLGEKDPYNIFLKAKQLAEAKEQEEQAAIVRLARENAAKEEVVEQDEGENPTGRFQVPYYESDSDDDEEEEEESATTAEQTVDDQASNTPPPPPRPSNAQLPQPTAGVGIGMASFQKYKPAVPSKLRHVEEMSPLQIEKAKRESMGKENQAPGYSVPDLRLVFQEATEKFLERKAAGGVIEYVGEDDPEEIRKQFIENGMGYML
jgi:hypothetical protein